ncbi:hypothetical protein [Streptomyces sp. NPDC046870]|uniref:hypothetical protein n=1 Tax=Streptomyces sp. NPDC046870 TaxID=3155135 RepID=UPI003453A760
MKADASDTRYGTACATSSGSEVRLTRTPATGAGPHGIRVDALAPGWMRPPVTDRHDREARTHTGQR